MNADPRGYYAALHLTPDATQAEIQRAFRALMRLRHPDVGPTGPGEDERRGRRAQHPGGLRCAAGSAGPGPSTTRNGGLPDRRARAQAGRDIRCATAGTGRPLGDRGTSRCGPPGARPGVARHPGPLGTRARGRGTASAAKTAQRKEGAMSAWRRYDSHLMPVFHERFEERWGQGHGPVSGPGGPRGAASPGPVDQHRDGRGARGGPHLGRRRQPAPLLWRVLPAAGRRHLGAAARATRSTWNPRPTRRSTWSRCATMPSRRPWPTPRNSSSARRPPRTSVRHGQPARCAARTRRRSWRGRSGVGLRSSPPPAQLQKGFRR